MPEQTQTPRVLWAQQRETVLLTIAVPDLEKVDVKFEENSVAFRGQVSTGKPNEQTVYAVKIDLYEKIDPDTSKYENIGQKYWRLLLKKKDATAVFWPRLTKDKTRLHWLQTDFDHWKDEDASDDEKPGFGGNFQDMFSGGMGGMPGMGGDFGGDDDEGDDEDDEDDMDGDKPAASTSENKTHEDGQTINGDATIKNGEEEKSA